MDQAIIKGGFVMKPRNLIPYLQTMIEFRMPVLLVGAPGVGKTDCVTQAAEKADANLIISHPVVSDPTDFKGLPFAFTTKDGQTNATFLPIGDLDLLIKAEKPTVFFLDDLGQAPSSVQAAAMQLLLARRINGHMVSDMVTFVAATNRREDRAGVQGILEPVKSRFVSIIHFDVDMNDWTGWAFDHDMPMELISLIRFKPDLLFDFKPTKDMVNTPNPRTVANAGKLFNTDLEEDIKFEAIKGAAGEGFAVEFRAFAKIWNELPDIDNLIMNPTSVDIPTDPAVRYAMCGAITERATKENFDRIMQIADRLPGEFQAMVIKDSAHRNPKVCTTRAYTDWIREHEHLA